MLEFNQCLKWTLTMPKASHLTMFSPSSNLMQHILLVCDLSNKLWLIQNGIVVLVH